MEFSLEIERPSQTLHKLNIKVPSQEVKSHFDRKLAAIQRTAKIKGFRRGQVPISLVKQYYGDDVRNEVFRMLVDGALDAAVSREKIRMVGTPQIETLILRVVKTSRMMDTLITTIPVFREDQELAFTATVEVMPEIEVDGYTGVSLTRHQTEIKDQQVEKVVNQLRIFVVRFLP